MQLNSLIFPAPVASYSLNSELIWIPKSPSSPLFSPTRTSKNSFRISMKRKDLGQEIEQSSFASCKDFKTPTNFSSFHTSLQHRNSFTLRKIKDFGFHNHLFSMKTTHSTSHKNENPKVKGMNFKSFSQQNTENSIPCLFYEYPEKSNFLLVHFHANAEDIGDSFKYMKIVGSLLKVYMFLILNLLTFDEFNR